MIVDAQGLCANWKGQEIQPKRVFSHQQDFPVLTDRRYGSAVKRNEEGACIWNVIYL